MNYTKVDIYFILPHFLIFTKDERYLQCPKTTVTSICSRFHFYFNDINFSA